MEWDTGAAHAIVNESGGQLNDQKNNYVLKYNTKEKLLNNYFAVVYNGLLFIFAWKTHFCNKI